MTEELIAEGLRAETWERLREIAAQLAAGDPDVAYPLALRLLGSDDDEAVGLGAEVVDAIPAAEPYEDETHGTILLESDVNFSAAQHAVLVALIIRRLAGAGEDATISLLHAARHRDDLAALPAVLARATDPSADVRRTVAETLHMLGPEDHAETTATLLRLARDEDDDVVDWALFSLGRGDEPLDTPEARALYEANVDHEHDGIRHEARKALALLGAVGYLEERLQDFLEGDLPDTTTSQDTITAAGRTRDPRLHAPLVALREKGWGRGWAGLEPIIDTAITATAG
jgi:HEAT repeats